VLVLDGGGYRGMFCVAAMAFLEQDLNVRLVDHFDLIVGTSTGGIIALGLGLGMSPEEIVEFYLEDGAQIFKHAALKTTRQLVRPKYNSLTLRHALNKLFESKVLEDSKKRLCIPSYDLTRDKVHLFRTPHLDRLNRDGRTPVVDVALATTAAPTYFAAHAMDGLRLIDGGVWANTPVPTAINEAVNGFGVNFCDLRILSFGTTSTVCDRPKRLDRGGLGVWSFQVTDVLLRAQAEAAVNTLRLLLPPENWHRLDTVVPTGLGRLDRVQPKDFIGHAAGVSREQSPEIEKKFLDHLAPVYTPFKKPTRSANS